MGRLVIREAVRAIFHDVFHGTLRSHDAGRLLHLLCNKKGLNPAIEEPITMLMMSPEGRDKLQAYEEFIMNLNWVMAKLAAQELNTEEAYEEFLMEVEELNGG